MKEESSLGNPRRTFILLGKQVLCIFIEVVFLCLWVLAQYLLSLVIRRLELAGMEKWVLKVFQVFFTISTLAPIAIHICRDVTVMIIDGIGQAKEAIKKNRLKK